MSATSLFDLLTRIAEQTPDRPALIVPAGPRAPAREMSYGELRLDAERACSALERAGVEPGDRVGLWFDKSPEAVAALLGVLLRGAAYVPLDPAAPLLRAAGIAAHAEVKTLVTSRDRAEKRLTGLLGASSALALTHVVVPEAPAASAPAASASDAGPALLAWRALDPPANASRSDSAVDRKALAYVLFTSGSTGAPKGVELTHDNALCFVESAVAHFGLEASDVFISHAPLHFDLSVFDLFCAFAVGGRVVLLPEHASAFPKTMAQAIEAHGVTIWGSVASALTLLTTKVDLTRFNLSSVRLVVSSGEALAVPLARAVRAAFPNAVLFNAYGQTEANTSLAERIDLIPDDDTAKLPIGTPLPGFEVFALDPSGRRVEPAGETGELYVGGPTVARGYFRDPQRTEERFVVDPRAPDSGARVYRTGDLVRRDAVGCYVYAGRTDDLVKTRGYRVELGEVELALGAAEGVAAAAVVAVPDPLIGCRLVGFAEARPGAAIDVAALTAFLAERLPRYMVPETIEVLDRLPRTSTGKVDRRALAATIPAPEAST